MVAAALVKLEMKFFLTVGVLFAWNAIIMQCSARAFIGSGTFGNLLGSSMYRYTYDMQTGTSHYLRDDGSIDSWTSPQKREFMPGSYRQRNDRRLSVPQNFLNVYTNFFLR